MQFQPNWAGWDLSCAALTKIINVCKHQENSTGQSVDQTSGIVIVTEGQSLFLKCAYEAQFSGINYPFWYIQHPGQPLEILLNEIDTKTQSFQATHHKNKQKGTFNMQKQAIQLKDSAVYFCAFQETR
uniref:Ig-like domain-containing protein n=1 Tax=Naja naja TaxID=35670 RepID=A0A8C6VSB7_NAJNA